MLSLMLRSLVWAAWWPASTWLLALEKATAQAGEAFQSEASASAPRPENDAQPQPQQEWREQDMATDAFTKMEMPDSLRDLMKMGIEQARYAFETFAETNEKALRALESNSGAARDSLRSLNDKIADITRRNAEANFSLALKLAEAKDFNEAISMQSEHMKTQMERFASQMEEIRDLAAKVIQESNAGRGGPSGFGGAFGSGERGTTY